MSSSVNLLIKNIVFVYICQFTYSQQIESITRTTNSVDIQLCVSSIMSNSKDTLQTTISENLQTILQSSAVYLARTYTTELGTICFLYVYQSTSPQNARDAVPVLTQHGGIFSFNFQSRVIQSTVTAIPWQGEDSGVLGAGLPWQWTGSDAVLWGGSISGVLLTFVLGVCCYVRLTASREHERVEKLLMRDRDVIRELIPKLRPKDIIIKKKDNTITPTITPNNKPYSTIIPILSDKNKAVNK